MRHGSLTLLFLVSFEIAACSSTPAATAQSGPPEPEAGTPSADGAAESSVRDAGHRETGDGGCVDGIVCNQECLAAGESAGNCTAILTNLTNDSSDMALSTTHVYYVGGDLSSIWRVAKMGGSPELVAGDQGIVVTGLATNATHLYFVSASGDPDAPNLGSVRRLPLAGGAAEVLSGAGYLPWDLAIGATDVFWVGPASNASDSYGPAVHRVALGGGKPSDVAIGYRPFSLAVDATDVYWADHGIVWKANQSTAGSVPLGDGGPDAGTALFVVNTTVGAAGDRTRIALDTDYLYWTGGGVLQSGLHRIRKSGGAAEEVTTTENSDVLVVDSADVFYTTFRGEIVRYHKSDGSTATLATTTTRTILQIAVDATSVYALVEGYPTGGGGALLKIAK